MRKFGLIVVMVMALMSVLSLPVMAQEGTETPVPTTPTIAPIPPPTPAAELRVESLRVEPQQVKEGAQTSVVLEIVNLGESASSITLKLEIDDDVFETRSVQVDGGERTTVTFTVPSLNPGLHTVRIGDTEARFKVLAKDAIAATDEGCNLRAGMQVRLQNIVNSITADQDGHVELSFRNPPVNDCVVQADLRIIVPSNIIPIAKEGVISGAAGSLNAFVEVPANGERAVIMDFKGLKIGEYFITFSGTYWPKGNKDLFQPITLQQKLVVVEPSRPFDTSIPGEPVPPSDGQIVAPADSTGGIPNIWLIVLIILVLVVLVSLVAIVGISRRGGRTTIIND